MKRVMTAGWLLLLSILMTIIVPTSAGEHSVRRASVITIEGVVNEISLGSGEGGLDVVVVGLAPEDGGESVDRILLAPVITLNQIGFSVAVGDRLRARVFPEPDQPMKAQKVSNLSRDRTVRFRTMRKYPLWNERGAWHGVDDRGRGHGHGQGHGAEHGGGQQRKGRSG